MRRLRDLIFPHFFVKEPIRDITNPSFVQTIKNLEKCSTAREAMEQALIILASKYQSKRFESLLFLHKAYEKDPNVLWQRSGFMHCTHQNYLFRI